MVELLNGLTSKEQNIRDQATKMFKDAKASKPDEVVINLMKIVAWSEAKQADKKMALVYLRQCLSPEHHDSFIFPKLQDGNKKEIAQALLVLFEKESDDSVRRSVGSVIESLVDFVCDTKDPRGWIDPSGSWPALLTLLLNMANCQVNTNASSCGAAMDLIGRLLDSMKDSIMKAQSQTGVLLQHAFGCNEIKIKVAATKLICNMVQKFEKKEYAPLLATIPTMLNVCQELAASQKLDELESILKEFNEITDYEPDFWKTSMQQSMEPANFLGGCVKSKDATEEIRGLAMEWLTSYGEKKPKWIVKAIPQYSKNMLECCMALMLEVEDGEGPLKEWAERMDDEEGEEDADALAKQGEECIDRYVEAVGMESVSQFLFPLVAQFAQQDAWQSKHAALCAIKQTVEYVEDQSHVGEMAKLLINHLKHPHPRIRYTSLHAIGQLANDQAPQFQEEFHQTVMPLLLEASDDQVDRVAAMAMSAFVSFAEEIASETMTHYKYAQPFMEKFMTRLQSTAHRGIQEESITAIAVIAGVLAEDFKVYYDGTMPKLKQLIISCTDEKTSRLRGKAFECLSLLCGSVGKELAFNDAKEAIEAMLSEQTASSASDIQRDYIKEALERLCHCLKKEFAHFLPKILPGLFQTLDLEQDQGFIPKKNNDDDDQAFEIDVKGKTVKVRSSKLEEMQQAVQMLTCFIEHTEEAYFDFIQPTAEKLLVVLRFDDDAAMLADDARDQAFMTWAWLVDSAKKGAEARNMPSPNPLVKELLSTMLKECLPVFQKALTTKQDELDLDEVGKWIRGMSQSLKYAGVGYIGPDEGKQLVQPLMALIDASSGRSRELESKVNKKKSETPQELQGDEDDEEDPGMDEESFRRCCEEGLGSVMKANPDCFTSELGSIGEKMKQWLNTKSDLILGLHLACDLLEHLQDKSCPVWPICMPVIFSALEHKDPDARTAASYAVNLAAIVPQFSEAAPTAFEKIAKVISSVKVKKQTMRRRSRWTIAWLLCSL